jgi:hypothetical protein
MKRPVLAVAVVTAFALTTGVVQAADPSTAECLAATESSVKLGNEHKLRAERAQFLVCAAASCPADIRKDCASQAESVSAQIPTIIFAAKDPSGADLSAVKVTMDGEVLTERLAGIALSIDPGEHTFTFETAGQSPVTTKFMIQQAQKDRRELVTFGSPVPVPDTSSPQGVRESMGEPASSTGANVRRSGLGGGRNRLGRHRDGDCARGRRFREAKRLRWRGLFDDDGAEQLQQRHAAPKCRLRTACSGWRHDGHRSRTVDY